MVAISEYKPNEDTMQQYDTDEANHLMKIMAINERNRLCNYHFEPSDYVGHHLDYRIRANEINRLIRKFTTVDRERKALNTLCISLNQPK